MPTILPQHRPAPAPQPAPPAWHELRALMVSAAILMGVLGLVCEKFLPPTPGYSLARTSQDLQLSP